MQVPIQHEREKCTLRSSTKFEKLQQSAPRKAYYKVLPEKLTTECSRREALTQAPVSRKTLSPHLSHSVFAEVIGNQLTSTLSLFGILLLCRDDIAYLSEDPPVAASAIQIISPRYYNNHQKVIIYFIIPQKFTMELLLNTLIVAMARS